MSKYRYTPVLSLAAVATAIAAAPIAAQTATPQFVAKQAAGESSTAALIGLNVTNSANESVGDINYLVLDGAGKVTTIVIGVGGVAGIGEKNVGVPYSAVQIATDGEGKQTAKLDATKDALQSAPKYEWTEKSTLQKMKDQAADMATKAKEKAGEWADKASEKAGEVKENMTKDTPEPAPTPKAQ